MKPLSRMPTIVVAPLNRVNPYEMVPGRMMSASMSGVLWSCEPGRLPDQLDEQHEVESA